MQLFRVWQADSKPCDSGASCHLTRQEVGSQGAKMEGKEYYIIDCYEGNERLKSFEAVLSLFFKIMYTSGP